MKIKNVFGARSIQVKRNLSNYRKRKHVELLRELQMEEKMNTTADRQELDERREGQIVKMLEYQEGIREFRVMVGVTSQLIHRSLLSLYHMIH